MFFFCFVVGGTGVFKSEKGLANTSEGIGVFSLSGGQDAFFARQFGSRAMGLGLTGGLLGLALGLPTLMGIGYLIGRMDGFFVPSLELGAHHWMIVGFLPIGVAAIATVTAKMTVLRSLRRML